VRKEKPSGASKGPGGVELLSELGPLLGLLLLAISWTGDHFHYLPWLFVYILGVSGFVIVGGVIVLRLIAAVKNGRRT